MVANWRPGWRYVGPEYQEVEVLVLDVYDTPQEEKRYGVDRWIYRLGYQDTEKRFDTPEEAVKYARKLVNSGKSQQACVVDYRPNGEGDSNV